VCECGGPLLARYDPPRFATTGTASGWAAPATMWRYAALLPVSKPSSVVSLGEV
jgi:threonine synthase